MKKKSDPRHKHRVKLMKALFENTFRGNLDKVKDAELAQILSSQKEIDNFISKNAPAWPIAQIAPVDLATLRLAIWELKFKEKKEPFKAIIDEAVEISKEYGGENSPSFINGVLGSIMKSSI